MGSRCDACQKKVGLLGFQCGACRLMLCTAHRLAEDHQCANMHVFKSTDKLKEANPKVAPSKIVKI